MLKNIMSLSGLRNERGVTLIFVALTLIVLLGIAALALDIGHLFVTKNELQNAADAGALAGARNLYLNDGTAVNPECNSIAKNTAIANMSDKAPVEVTLVLAGDLVNPLYPNDPSKNFTENDLKSDPAKNNKADVQRGHWSFATRTFEPNDSLSPPELWGHTTEELDADINFINAVQVIARRESVQISSWFARIFGYEGFTQAGTAIAYIGFAGSIQPHGADQPIAICAESLIIDGKYMCSIGRMLNSGPNTETSNTGAWTKFYTTMRYSIFKLPCAH